MTEIYCSTLDGMKYLAPSLETISLEYLVMLGIAMQLVEISFLKFITT